MHALSGSNIPIENLSESDDTRNLIHCLSTQESEIHVGQGATTLRFLLAYLALSKKNSTLHCSQDLKTRPLKNLLDILKQLGCQFEYLENEYQLPLRIVKGIQEHQHTEVRIDTSESSQFVSAILMISPYLPSGLNIQFSDHRVSEPYIRMTYLLMQEFGAKLLVNPEGIQVLPSTYKLDKYIVEADWSAASFFFALLRLKEKGSIVFPGLKHSGLQGDEIVNKFFSDFGIHSKINSQGLEIYIDNLRTPEFVEFDFTNYPDMFPPIAIFCAIVKVNCRFKGLQHLVFKESNRLKIISDFLIQQNVPIHHIKSISGDLSAEFDMSKFNFDIPKQYSSHNDHRIAMSFSLLACIGPIQIQNPEVVAKSFPDYWNQFNKILPNKIIPPEL